MEKDKRPGLMAMARKPVEFLSLIAGRPLEITRAIKPVLSNYEPNSGKYLICEAKRLALMKSIALFHISIINMLKQQQRYQSFLGFLKRTRPGRKEKS